MTKKVYEQKYLYFWGSLKNLTFRGGGVPKNQYRAEDCLKRGGGGAWTVCWFKGGLARKRGCF